jgi:hypothetical protein
LKTRFPGLKSGLAQIDCGVGKAQGLKPNVFSIVYGPTKSHALIQNMSLSAASKVRGWHKLTAGLEKTQGLKPNVLSIVYGPT